jgi:hypothetical protein
MSFKGVGLCARDASGKLTYQDTARIVAEQLPERIRPKALFDPGQARSDGWAVFGIVHVRSRGVGQALLD